MTLPKDRTNIIAIIGLTVVTPLLAVAAADPRFAAYAAYILVIRSALSDIGNLFARDNKVSDQQAGARIESPDGTFHDAKASTSTIAPSPDDTMSNLGTLYTRRKP